MDIGFFIDDGLCSWRCHPVPVPVIPDFGHFVGRYVGTNLQMLMKIDGVLDLGGKLVPQLDWENGVGCT